MATRTKARPLSERELVGRLEARYAGENGNGPAGTLVPQVRNAAGFDAKRTIDALGFHFWPSRGLLIDGYECKSSRSDWTRELANPEKADEFCRLVDRFYVVAGRTDLVKVDEVPPDWGLIVPSGNGLREVKPAVVMHAETPAVTEWVEARVGGKYAAGPRPLPPGFTRSFLTALVRQATRVTDAAPEQLERARQEGKELAQLHGRRDRETWQPMYHELREKVRAFEQALGSPITGLHWGAREPAEVGRALRAILDGEAQVDALRNRLSAAAENAQRVADEARARLETLDTALEREVTA